MKCVQKRNEDCGFRKDKVAVLEKLFFLSKKDEQTGENNARSNSRF